MIQDSLVNILIWSYKNTNSCYKWLSKWIVNNCLSIIDVNLTESVQLKSHYRLLTFYRYSTLTMTVYCYIIICVIKGKVTNSNILYSRYLSIDIASILYHVRHMILNIILWRKCYWWISNYNRCLCIRTVFVIIIL